MADELTCIWPINVENCCPPVESGSPSDSPGDVDPDVLRFAEVASSILSRMSAYTIGVCETTIRPLGACSVCRGRCACGGADGIHLFGPMGIPVYDVISVSLGGVEYPEEEWRYDRDLNTLWHVPPGRWPTNDERWSECGAGDAFCVEVVLGDPPDAWALNVAESLTCELLASCRGGKCRIPRNATQITAQGVTVQLRDDEINMLLPEVAAWVSAVNPHGARLPARVYSPDTRPTEACSQPFWRGPYGV